MYKLGLDTSTCKIVNMAHVPLRSRLWNLSLLFNLAYHSCNHAFKQLYTFQPEYALLHSPHNYLTYSYISFVLVFFCFPWACFSLLKHPRTYYMRLKSLKCQELQDLYHFWSNLNPIFIVVCVFQSTGGRMKLSLP